jgi:subtilisin family serine protease
MALPPLADAAVAGAEVDALAARAAAAGEIRVIVQLQRAPAPVGLMTVAEAAQWRRELVAQQQAVAAQTRGSGARELHRYRHIPFVLYKAGAMGVRALGAAPEVVGLQQDIAEPPLLAQSATIIGAPAAWTQGANGSGQVIAVLDTGVDPAHAFFSAPGKIVAEACFSSNVSATITSLCPEAVDATLEPGSGAACPAEVSGCAHGTHVAGIAAGDDGNGPDIGIAPGAGLISIQVNSRFDSGAESGSPAPYAASFPADQTRALEQVFDWRETYPIAAVNLSLGGGNFSDQAECDQENPLRKAAIDNLRSVGIATIAAAGNSGQRDAMTQPGCISGVVSVGATTDDDLVADFSNVAPFISLLAPGVDISSAALGGGVVEGSGTSMATPHVAGAWAVLRQAAPAAPVEVLLAALQSTGTPVDDQRSDGGVTGMARINLDQALAAVQNPEPEFNSSPAGGATLDFGMVLVGTNTAEAVVTAGNLGNSELTLNCALGGPHASRFAILTCPASVPPLGSVALRATCNPAAPGPLVASLEVSTNDADESLVTFALTCDGVTELTFGDGFESGG